MMLTRHFSRLHLYYKRALLDMVDTVTTTSTITTMAVNLLIPLGALVVSVNRYLEILQV